MNFCNVLPKNAKQLTIFFLKYWGLSGAKTCKSCRSRQELSNEYLLAKFSVDTEENEPYKICSFGWKIREWFDIEPFNYSPDCSWARERRRNSPFFTALITLLALLTRWTAPFSFSPAGGSSSATDTSSSGTTCTLVPWLSNCLTLGRL